MRSPFGRILKPVDPKGPETDLRFRHLTDGCYITMTKHSYNISAPVLALVIETEIPEHFLNVSSITALECKYADTTPELIDRIGVEAVFCPLISGSFDAIDVGAVLEASNSTVPLYVIAPPLPCPGMVLQEIQAACPSLAVFIYDPTENRNTLPRIA